MTSTPTCAFCHGKPVGNAATWLDGKPRPPAACPRCGVTTFPDGSVATFEEQLEAVSRAALTPAPDMPLSWGQKDPEDPRR